MSDPGDEGLASKAAQLSHAVGLWRPATARGLFAIVVGVFLLLWPQLIDQLLARITGVALLFSAGMELYQALRSRPGDHQVGRGVRLVAQLLAGVVLIVSPQVSLRLIGSILGLVLLAFGALDIRESLQRRGTDVEWSWRFVRGVLAVAIGLFALLFPQQIVPLTLALLGAAWVFVGAVSLRYGAKHSPDDEADALHMVHWWLQDNAFDSDDRDALTARILFEGPEFGGRLSRFSVLMFLSSAIAAFGVISDQTAVVIGAMLVAPLMTPIMGTAAALLMGWSRRALVSGLIVLGAAVGGVAVGWILSAWLPLLPQVINNPQITSRTSPTLIDLGIALAAGAAGAFALTRSDISDSLPGVAVAVALVPPLSVVGITMQYGEWEMAAGALLLFLTNLVAIMFTAMLVFFASGYTPLDWGADRQRFVRTSVAGVVVGLVVVTLPLAALSQSTIGTADETNTVAATVEEWLVGAPKLQVTKIVVKGSQIDVQLAGSGAVPPINELGGMLDAALAEPFTLVVGVNPEVQATYESDGATP